MLAHRTKLHFYSAKCPVKKKCVHTHCHVGVINVHCMHVTCRRMRAYSQADSSHVRNAIIEKTATPLCAVTCAVSDRTDENNIIIIIKGGWERGAWCRRFDGGAGVGGGGLSPITRLQLVTCVTVSVVKVDSSSSHYFEGFLLLARSKATTETAVGKFSIENDEKLKLLNCFTGTNVSSHTLTHATYKEIIRTRSNTPLYRPWAWAADTHAANECCALSVAERHWPQYEGALCE